MSTREKKFGSLTLSNFKTIKPKSCLPYLFFHSTQSSSKMATSPLGKAKSRKQFRSEIPETQQDDTLIGSQLTEFAQDEQRQLRGDTVETEYAKPVGTYKSIDVGKKWLLNSGQFSDLTLYCHGYKFDVHKSIVCMGSERLSELVDGLEQEQRVRRL